MGGGRLWVRVAHTALSCGLALGLFLHRTDLQKQEERGELLQPLIFVSLVLCSILLYFRVSLMDPGFVKAEEEEKADKSEEQSVAIPLVPSNIKLRRCGYCMVKGFDSIQLPSCLVLSQQYLKDNRKALLQTNLLFSHWITLTLIDTNYFYPLQTVILNTKLKQLQKFSAFFLLHVLKQSRRMLV